MAKDRRRAERIEQRAKEHGALMIREGRTIRQVAAKTGFSVNTVHLDLTKRLPHIHPAMASMVRTILDYNHKMRAYRGGMRTQQLWRERRG